MAKGWVVTPLVEIIRGKETSDETLAKAFDLAQALGKTPIVVNDAPGFFTTRTISTTISQGASMVVEGISGCHKITWASCDLTFSGLIV